MNISWLSWSNPVSFWWVFLTVVSLLNVSLWIFSYQYLTQQKLNGTALGRLERSLIWLSAIYVFVCAFRSVLPRADVQRICLFDTWLSSVLVGRSLATFAEVSFVIQWALVLHRVGTLTQVRLTKTLSLLIVPLILLAECFSWYAVISTHYLGNTCEESLWALTYTLIGLSLFSLMGHFKGSYKYAVVISFIGCCLYVLFMTQVDVPMYWNRWHADSEAGKPLLGFTQGLSDLKSTWRVTYDIEDWKQEIPWMTLYFSFAVWTSLALCYVPLSRERLANWFSARHILRQNPRHEP
jgi:hypothetical protein